MALAPRLPLDLRVIFGEVVAVVVVGGGVVLCGRESKGKKTKKNNQQAAKRSSLNSGGKRTGINASVRGNSVVDRPVGGERSLLLFN
jgi:hypothetical protein